MKKTIKKAVAAFFMMIIASVSLGSMLTMVLTDTLRGYDGKIPVNIPKIVSIEVLIPLLFVACAYIGKRKHSSIQAYAGMRR